MRNQSFVLFALFLSGCGNATESTTSLDVSADVASDSAVMDSSADSTTDMSVADAKPDLPSEVSSETATEVGSDVGFEIGDVTADVVADTAKDVAPVDSGCAYANVDDVVVKCGDTYKMVNYFDVVPRDPACPGYWFFGGRKFTSPESAATESGCSDTCIYRFSTSVTRLYCGRRTGYEVLRADGKGCADQYRFSEGYFPSVAAHDLAFPCK